LTALLFDEIGRRVDEDERMEAAGKLVGLPNFAIPFSFFWHFSGITSSP